MNRDATDHLADIQGLAEALHGEWLSLNSQIDREVHDSMLARILDTTID